MIPAINSGNCFWQAISTDDRDGRALWMAQRLTIDTQSNCWINLQPCLGNFFAATKTIAIIITVDPPACRRQSGQPCLRRSSRATSMDCCCIASMRDRRPTDCWSSWTGARDSRELLLNALSSVISLSISCWKKVTSITGNTGTKEASTAI